MTMTPLMTTLPPMPTPVICETPYAGDVPLHLRYLRACMRDCLMRGEAPFASHHQYTAPGVLRDEVATEREQGIRAGFAWRTVAHRTVFYVDFGWSSGMRFGLDDTLRLAQPWEERTLGPDWLDEQLVREARGQSLMHWFRSVCAR
jgi:hypothetical protein